MMTNSNAGHRERLREKFLKASIDGLHDYEKIELLLTFAIPRRDVKPLAKGLLKKFNGFRGLMDAGHDDLCSSTGVGENVALLIKAVKEVSSAYMREQGEARLPVRSPQDVSDYIDRRAGLDGEETFMALYLNSKNEILGLEPLHEGPLKEISITPRKMIEGAFRHNARSIIFVHFLPGRDAIPSVNERVLVRDLEEAASALDIIVHDHLIKARKTFLSAREIGWLKTG